MKIRRTEFLNVDLDIYSKFNLAPLVALLGKRVSVHYVGRQKRTYEAHLELAHQPKSADIAIREFVAIITSLPKGSRKIWNEAKMRDFNIGIRAGMEPHSYEFALEHKTVQEAAQLNARIAFTIYAAEITGTSQTPSTL